MLARLIDSCIARITDVIVETVPSTDRVLPRRMIVDKNNASGRQDVKTNSRVGIGKNCWAGLAPVKAIEGCRHVDIISPATSVEGHIGAVAELADVHVHAAIAIGYFSLPPGPAFIVGYTDARDIVTPKPPLTRLRPTFENGYNPGPILENLNRLPDECTSVAKEYGGLRPTFPTVNRSQLLYDG